MSIRALGQLIAILIFFACCSEAKATCLADEIASGDAGRWTSGQLSNSQVSPLVAMAGMRCSAADFVPGANPQVTATVTSANGFELRLVGADASIGYVARANRDGAPPILQGGQIEFTAEDLPKLTPSGGGTDALIPISFASFRGQRLPAGRYSDVLTIEWRWRTCKAFSVLHSMCAAYQTSTARTVFSLSMEVDARPPIFTMSAKTITTSSAEAKFSRLHSSGRIVTVTVQNPDVVAIDPDSIVLNIPIDRQMLIADHFGGQAKAIEVIRGTEDGMRVYFGGLQDASDDVECTSDGIDWTLQPADPSLIRSVRIRVRGTLQPGKSVTVALTGAAVDR